MQSENQQHDHRKQLISSYQSHYHVLDLTEDQALAVIRCEEETPSGLSEFESYEYNLFHFRQILNETQFTRYATHIDEARNNYIRHLQEIDEDKTIDIAHTREKIAYYRDVFYPACRGQLQGILFGQSRILAEKIAYLRATYTRHLEGTRNEVYISHFRFSRGYQPNTLECTLLQQQLKTLYPDYEGFRRSMDAPTLGMANYVYQELSRTFSYYREKINEIMGRHDADMKNLFQKHLFEKHGVRSVDEMPGWHIFSPHQEEHVKKEITHMRLLLLDFKNS